VLSRLPGGDWNVDSFFDLTYRIDFAGAAGGPLGGFSGSTTGTIRMQAGDHLLDVGTAPGVPRTGLESPRPNPFTPETTVPFLLEAAGRVELLVFDAAGRLVRQLVNGPLEAGHHSASWNGRDANDHLVASGVYFFELRVDGRLVDQEKTTFLE
jgi:hypothetical protein